jgi:hypothetical protein
LAKGGGIPDWALAGGVLIGGYLLYKEGLLTEPIAAGQKVIDEIFSKLKGAPSLGGGEGSVAPEEGGGTTGGSTGSCTGGPYKGTGKTVSTSKNGPKTRHYASGKADDKTVEMNAKGISFKNYQFVNYVTMNSIEHDDTISTKFGGTHMGTGWYDHGVSFNSGQGCLGTEKKHPSTQSCVVKGKSVGKIVGKKTGVAGVYFGNAGGGGRTEIWADVGTGWQKLAEGNNVGGFAPKASSQEAQLRIDGFNSEPTIHCSVVQEIGTTTGAFAPTTQSKLARSYDDFTSRQYQLMNTVQGECGFKCSEEMTYIPDIQAIQRSLRR